MATAGLEVGASVLVRSQRATVRFVGETDFAEGVWVGLSLQRAVGRNDGSVRGVRYFTCLPEHGLFVPPSHVTTAPATTVADQSKVEIVSAWSDIESLREAEALQARVCPVTHDIPSLPVSPSSLSPRCGHIHLAGRA